MLENEGKSPSLAELYNRYDGEDLLIAYGLGVASLIVGISLIMGGSTLSYNIHSKELLDRWAIDVIKAAAVSIGGAGIGLLAYKVSEVRKGEIALQIAQAEDRIADDDNDMRVMYTSVLASTLVYGIEFRNSFLSRLVNAYVRPVWEGYIPYVTPEERKIATFQSFDRGVELIPFDDDWSKREIGLAALNLGKEKWQNIARGKGSNRLRSYSFVMLSEINRRLGDAPPK